MKHLFTLKAIFLAIATSAYAESDYATGGLSGAVRSALDEAVKNGHISGKTREEITGGYDTGQRFLGEMFHRGQTGQIANPMRGAAQNLIKGIDKISSEQSSNEVVPEAPIASTSTTDLPEISEQITVPQREPETVFEEGPETQWCINSCLSTNGGNPASSAYQQCVANNCYPSQTASPPPKPQLSNAASYLANQHIGDGCEGRGGSINPKGLTIRDLDGDGRDDLIIADEWIVCNGAKQQSNTCGIKVCSAVIYVRRGAILQRSTSINATGIEVANGRRPTVTFLQHDLSTFAFGWNGSAFAQR